MPRDKYMVWNKMVQVVESNTTK